MKCPRVFLGLGANLGDRHASLRSGVAALAASPGFTLLRRASIYESPAMGDPDGPNFLNTAVAGTWTGAPEALLDCSLAIEHAHGRVRTVRDAPRTLDIDVLFWEHHTINTPRLVVPHPRLMERAFALLPLLELAPELRNPHTGQRLSCALDPVMRRQTCQVWRPEAARV